MKLTDKDRGTLDWLDGLLTDLGIHAARYRDDEPECWELTSVVDEDGRHYHGQGVTLRAAIEDMLERRAKRGG